MIESIPTQVWMLIPLYALTSWFIGHQASNLAAVRAGSATLNAGLLRAMQVYNLTMPHWIFLVWYGWTTRWYYALIVLVGGYLLRLVIINVETNAGLSQRAWAISLTGAFAVPLLLIAMALIAA